MISYFVRRIHPHRHFISFEAHFPTHGDDVLNVRLAAWRPGRYELGNFSRNIRAWQVHTPDGAPLAFRKTDKDTWQVSCAGQKEIVVRYEYYASELNAGSSYLDDEQLYINPVNCFFYTKAHAGDAYEISFDLPDTWQIACGLTKKSTHVLHAADFDELADCPLIASATLRHLQYTAHQVPFNIWIQGDVLLDETRLLNDFAAFTQAHFNIYGDIPCKEYHFLFHFPSWFVRHGVEHRNSTVIAMGPASEYQHEHAYHDLLGISCHELFHTWNIKCIRPAEMMPYDFSKENYSRLGYVAEGVTTYYGDLLLWRTQAFSDAEWYEVLNDAIQTHFDNPGRFNHSVADSSFDTWLDGYQAGIPWRKVSIYNEGCLVTLMCDLHILAATKGKRSMDDVMRALYDRFGKKGIGYTEADYRSIVEEMAGKALPEIFDDLINGQEDYWQHLQEALALVGLTIHRTASGKWSENLLGFGVDEAHSKATVTSVKPLSPADDSGLWIGDEIIAVNGVSPYKNFQSLLRMHAGTEMKFTLLRKGKVREATVKEDGREHAWKFALRAEAAPTETSALLWQRWKERT